MVFTCLILSVFATIDEYIEVASAILLKLVSFNFLSIHFLFNIINFFSFLGAINDSMVHCRIFFKIVERR